MALESLSLTRLPWARLMSAAGAPCAGRLTPETFPAKLGPRWRLTALRAAVRWAHGSAELSLRQTVNSWKILMTFISGPPAPHGHVALPQMVCAHHLTSSFLKGSHQNSLTSSPFLPRSTLNPGGQNQG